MKKRCYIWTYADANWLTVCFFLQVKVAQSCLTLCNPMDYTVHGILQARLLEWVAFPFSRWSSNPGIEPRSLKLQVDSLPAEPQGFMFFLFLRFTRVYVFSHCCCSVAKSCPTLCDPIEHSMPGFPVLHYLPEFLKTRINSVGGTNQPSHLLSPPSPPALNFSQHQGLFQRVSFSHQVANVLEFQLQHQSFQWVFRVDFL